MQDVLQGTDFSGARADLVLSCPQAACKESFGHEEAGAGAAAGRSGSGSGGGGGGGRISWYADGSAMHRIAVLRGRHMDAMR